jgi:hypothetical protein
MRYIILFAPNDETICVVHCEEDDSEGWLHSRIRLFESLGEAKSFVRSFEFFVGMPYQIVELNLQEY